VQRSLDDLGTPVAEVSFCVVDVETTGGSARDGAITEIGAVRLRGGVCEGTWSTLVDPGMPIPREITLLTGISAATVADAPPARDVLADFRAFVGDAVIVGHNVRYDLAFLGAELERAGFPPLQNRSLDTLALARRLVRDEVPNCKLGTLAERLRLDHRPSHRALDDALATGDLLHALLDRASGWGVLGLEDLLVLPRLAGHPQAAKLRLTDDLPHLPGVYLFRDRIGTVLYVGKATDLRSRVRSYFSGDDRRKVSSLLRETHAIDHEVCHHPLEAAVREIRLIQEHTPRYNRHSTQWRRMTYLRLTDEAFPRFSVVRTPPPDGVVHLGPLTSTSAAHRIIDAVTTVVPLRRCSERLTAAAAIEGRLALDDPDNPGTPVGVRTRRRTPCTPAQLGVSCCPCSGDTTPEHYAGLVRTISRGITATPALLLDPLRDRLLELAGQQRFEEAAEQRDRASALAEALRRQRRLDTWRRAARVVVELPDGSGAEVCHGLLGRVWHAGARPDLAAVPLPLPTAGPILRDQVHERMCIVTELERQASRWRVVHVDGLLASPVTRIDRFTTSERSDRWR
jgi:DNA polymerase-3 subunit epsilon